MNPVLFSSFFFYHKTHEYYKYISSVRHACISSTFCSCVTVCYPPWLRDRDHLPHSGKHRCTYSRTEVMSRFMQLCAAGRPQDALSAPRILARIVLFLNFDWLCLSCCQMYLFSIWFSRNLIRGRAAYWVTYFELQLFFPLFFVFSFRMSLRVGFNSECSY